MNTVIINKILVHMIDFEHRKIHLSDDFAVLNDTTQDYYHKKVEKALNSNQLKELVVPSLHEMLLRGDKMLESEDEFKAQAKETTEQFFKLGSQIEAMPNCNILYVDCYKDGDHMIAVLKLDYKYVPVSVYDDSNVRITRAQTLPNMGAAVDEAIVVNTDKKTLSLLEKKYLIDGKMNTYLNEQWIKGEEKLTDRQKYNTMKKVVNKLDDVYQLNGDTEAYPLMKQKMVEKIMNDEVIRPYEIVKDVVSKDDQASEEADMMMEDLGIHQEDTINSMTLSSSLQTCKLVTDTEITVSMSVDDYVAHEIFEKVDNHDGTSNLVLKNIKEITIK